MRERIRAFDWSSTPIGPIQQWPQSLKTILRIMLDSRYAMWLGWGPELSFFYNDAYRRDTLGTKHPWALGQPARAVWAEIWSDIGPRVDHVLSTGEATWDEGCLLFLERSGYSEETYHTFSYSPLYTDADAMGGMLCVVTEETERVVAERRVACLRDLASSLSTAKTEKEIFDSIEPGLTACRRDLPFTLTYMYGDDGELRLAAQTGITAGHPAITIEALSGWPLGDMRSRHSPIIVDDLARRFEWVPPGPWQKSPTHAMLLPIVQPGQTRPVGFFVAGITPHRPLDAYQGFVHLVVGQIAAAVANVRAYEEERQRAEALAELDRAKTAFFSNVSHEFRTPLTLMLGPVEELLVRSHTDLSPSAKGQLELVNRNGLRLLRLVNNLLDFSRVEAGRVQAVYEPTDLASFTAELASCFRSATERAGIALVVDCLPLSETVYVDRDMWEKIVLNLLSNAFKFTFEGEIGVALWEGEQTVELRVRDTGVGIPVKELTHLFERFHRIENTRSRTHEGSGIGLALVQELVKLHSGSVRVESRSGEGSTFIVTVPKGSAHLPAEKISARRSVVSTAMGAAPFVEEALRWLPSEDRTEDSGLRTELSESDSSALNPQSSALPGSPQHSVLSTEVTRPRVLVADDNADMRQYIERLLRERYVIEAVPDGEAALAAVRERRPDLIVTDVMMPRLDGFGLLRALRDDPITKTIPIIVLSARAGEESRVEGLEKGADDYLIKPFSARELLARVQAHLDIARVRGEAEERVTTILESLTDGCHVIDDAGRFAYFNRAARDMYAEQGIDADTLIGKQVSEAFPDAREQPAARALQRTLAERVPTEAENFYTPWGRWFAVRHYPTADGGVSTFFQDITERKQAEAGSAIFASLVQSSDDAIISKGLDGVITSWNAAAERVFGYSAAEAVGRSITMLIPSDRLDEEPKIIESLKRGDRVDHFETKRVRKDGSLLDISLTISPVRGADGSVVGASKIARDITERKKAENALHESEQKAKRARDYAEATLRTSPVPLLVLEKDLRVNTANEAFYATFQVNTAATQSCLVYELGNGQWNIPQLRDLLESILPQHTVFNGVEVTHEFESIGRRTMLLNARRMDNEPDTPERIVLVIEDITDRKQAEERLAQFTAELEQRVAERTYELAQSEDHLRTMATELNLAEQRERKRLATELHDHLQQMLVLGRLTIGQGKRVAASVPGR